RRRHTRFSRDWSSDVCSSDLRRREDLRLSARPGGAHPHRRDRYRRALSRIQMENEMILEPAKAKRPAFWGALATSAFMTLPAFEIGRASCRERVEPEVAGMAV